MSWTYLSSRYHFLIIVILLLTLVTFPFAALGIAFFYLLMIFLYRKREYLQEIDDPTLNKSLFSPVHGHVTSIEKSGTDTLITIYVPWYERGDIVMPVSAEVVSYKNSPVRVGFITPEDNSFVFIINSNRLVRRHPFYLWPGDRGRSRASVGFLLLGGEMLLKLSENYTIIVEINKKVEAGKTPLAITKE